MVKDDKKIADDLALEAVAKLKSLLDQRGKGELAKAVFGAAVLESWLRYQRDKDFFKRHRGKSAVRFLSSYVTSVHKLFDEEEWAIVREEITMLLLGRMRDHCAVHILELQKERRRTKD